MQNTYILDFLAKTNMLGAKFVATPMQTTPKLSLTSGTLIQNVTQTEWLLGAYSTLLSLVLTFFCGE